ncbi:sialate O-acetylesterase [Phenylobacterium sp.]|jgi:Ca2+-binding RTX toxin-like protein|uniref:sialate O-acetylesterase n=1 Tax=Phenylobacterium sp. TaxID=1871053 RepID=UPI002F95713A
MAFVVFAGQSNTGGYQSYPASPPAWTPDPKIQIWDAGQKTWVTMQPGVNTGYPGFPNTWGPETQFALAFRQAFPNEPLRIVKVAEGGTGLRVDPAQWAYDWSPASDNELFDRARDVVRDATNAAGGQKPDAVFWGQGEEDANQAGWASNYGQNLQQLFSAIRAEWMGDANGKIGFFQIGSTPPFAADVRRGEQYVDDIDGNALSFDTVGLPMQGDTLHYAPEGYRMIGAEYFRLLSMWRGGGATLAGSGANDTLMGGGGDESISGGAGLDYLRGGAGRDVIAGGDAFDDVHGNEGDDTASGGVGNDWVVGGKDNDWLYGDAGDDIVYGNLGDDVCDGGVGADLVRGGQGNDVLYGWSGNDWLSGDRGDDTLTGGSGADIFHSFGDAGVDRIVDFARWEGDRVQLDPGTTWRVEQQGADTVVVLGGGGRVVLVGVDSATLGGDWLFVG